MSKSGHDFMCRNIPYRCCYEKAGMIEIEAGIFTRGYKVMPPDREVRDNYNAKYLRMCMEKILNDLSESFSFEFTIWNCPSDKEEYLSKIKLAEKRDQYSEMRTKYNNVLCDNFDIGHNNYKRNVYLTISAEARTPEEALKLFDASETRMKGLFSNLYGFHLSAMSLSERLDLLYCIYHPDMESTARDCQNSYFSSESMQRLKKSTKDVISPDVYECRERNYMRIGKSYARMFFINSIPKSICGSMLHDLASVSSNSILSVHYQALDQELGFQTVAKLVRANTEVHNIPIRESVADRKAQRMQRLEKSIRDNEEEYFYKSALDMFKYAKSKKQPCMQASFIISLFADSLEELNRDSSLLSLSASRYACQIRCFDFMQNEAFQSVLPLNNLKVDVRRILSIEDLAVVQPLDIQDIFDKVCLYYGLNAINDNCVLIDRKNYPVAVIAGSPHTGKTSAIKREIVNTLMSTEDEVIVLSKHPDEYAALIAKACGQLIEGFCPDIFVKDENYNLNDKKSILKNVFMEAYLAAKCDGCKQKDVLDVQIENEAKILCKFDSWDEALMYAKDHSAELRHFVDTMDLSNFSFDQLYGNNRFTVIRYGAGDELLTHFDYLWNYAVQRKKDNTTVWIFIDGADDLIYSSRASDYLVSILERADILRIPVTLGLQDVVRIVTNQNASIEFDYLLTKIQFFKLFSLGPVERKRFVDRLNISQQLIPFFVNQEPGVGVLITPSGNIAFNDHFEDPDNEFYKMFN